MRIYKLFDPVVEKDGDWEGYIKTIKPQGRILVKTPTGHQWVEPYQIRHKDEFKESKSKDKRTDLRFLRG